MSGGKSKSSASTTYNTSNYDNRVVVDSGGLVISGQLSNSTVALTDYGAVDAAQRIIAQQTAENATTFSNMLATLSMGHKENAEALELISQTFETVSADSLDSLTTLVERAFDAADNTANLSRELVELTDGAYADAASQAQGNKNLVYAGLLIAGVVAMTTFSK